jgi:adenylate cyclase
MDRIFASGLMAFERGGWDEAETCFKRVRQMDENDGPSRFYLQLCRKFRKSAPGDDWNGTVHLQNK